MSNFEIFKNAIANVMNAIEEANSKIEFFKKFGAVPSTYFGVTSIEGSHRVETTIFNAHVVRDNYGKILVVTERIIDGTIHYIGRSLFNEGEIDVTNDVEDEILYSGSIERCWYKWYQLQEK